MDDAEVVVSMLSDDNASRAVWFESDVVETLPDGCLAIESSTVSPGWSRLLSRAVGQRGRSFLEAPIEEREAHYASLTPGPAGEPLWRSDLYTAPKAVPAPAPPPAPPLADDELLLVTTTAG